MTVTEIAPAETPPDSPFAGETRPDPAGRRPDEPTATRPKWWRRRSSSVKAERQATDEGKPNPKGKRRRISAVDDFTDLAIGAGNMVCARTPYFATGRSVAMNGSVTGQMLDDAVAGSLLDRRAVQPLVRNRARFEGVVAIFETPAILFQIERGLMNPNLSIDDKRERVERYVPSLTRSVRRALPYMATAIVKVRKREEELRKAAVELYGAELADMVDPVAGVVDDLLAPIRAALDTMAARPPQDSPANPGAGPIAEGI